MENEQREIIIYDLMMNEQEKNFLVTEGSCSYYIDSLPAPKLVYDFLTTALHMDQRAEENIILLAMDAKAHVIGVFPTSHGTTTLAYVTPQDIFKRLLLVNAVSFVMAHNHPSGDCQPSNEDKKMTHRLYEAGSLMGIQLLDHIIVGRGEYYSFTEHDELK